MINLLTVVAKVFPSFCSVLFYSSTNLLTFFSAKNINVSVVLKDRNFNVTSAKNLIKF